MQWILYVMYTAHTRSSRILNIHIIQWSELVTGLNAIQY